MGRLFKYRWQFLMILPVVVLLFKHQCHKPLRRRIPHIRRELDRHRLAARDVRAFHLLDDKLDGFVRDGVDVLLDIRHEGELRIVERDECNRQVPLNKFREFIFNN